MGYVMTLLYHRVKDYVIDTQQLMVCQEYFLRQMEWIKNNYNVVSLNDDWSKINEKSICITFDDGYLDNFENALPILYKYNIPATIFVTAGYIGCNDELWWDELEKQLLVVCNRKKTFNLKDEMYSYCFDTSTMRNRKKTYENIHYLMKYFSDTEQRKQWMNQLKTWNKPFTQDRIDNCVVTREKLLAINEKIITIGAHTLTHPCLSRQTYATQKEEIQGSISKLSNIMGHDIKFFSYPFGEKTDYNNDSITLCKEAGILKAVSNYQGVWKSGDSLYEIPRNIVRDWDIQTFIKKINTFWRGL